MDAASKNDRTQEGLSRTLVLAIPLLMVSLSLIGFVYTQWTQATAENAVSTDDFGDSEISLGDFESSEGSWGASAPSSADVDGDEAPAYIPSPRFASSADGLQPQLSVPRMDEEEAGVITAGSEGLMDATYEVDGPLLDLVGNSEQKNRPAPVDNINSAPASNPVWLEGTIEDSADVQFSTTNSPLQQVLVPPPLRQ